MATNNSVQQGFHGNNSPHRCKECGLYLNSAESLEVHLQYHKENLLNKWATQAASGHSEETNNNTKGIIIKREFIANTISAAADSSDSMLKKSPDYTNSVTVGASTNRTTPELANFGHPPTPQSYHSAPSPYQTHTSDNSTFSPSFQGYQTNIKADRASPHYQQPYNYENQYFSMDPNYSQEYVHHKLQPHSFRYHPYSYDRNNSSQSQVTSSSPAYPPQPTPSPSPKQCDKCGCVCESAAQLIDHLNVAHPPTPYQQHQQNHQHFLFSDVVVKPEDDAQSEILDLDSHKVHHVFQEDEKSQNGDINGHHNPHSVSAMLSWPQNQRNNMHYMNGLQQIVTVAPDFMPSPTNGVTTTTQDTTTNYRPYEPPTQVISSTQVPNIPNSTPVSNQPPTGSTKGTNWKSNEARRPKTYNCTACNKWFTSSGHLKRHYNTTLHKNAVKSSGQPDPATMPISAHHHPGRDSCTSRAGETSPSDTLEDSRDDERTSILLQQPPNGPYDRQAPPNIQMQHNSLTNLTNGSPPNGEAGPSATTNLDTRGLLSIPSIPNSPFTTQGFNMSPMMHMDNSQFQMYPNASAPHVMQVMVTNNPSTTTGEDISVKQQALPSFAQIQSHRSGLLLDYGNGNVGGEGPATAPYTYYGDVFETVDSRQIYVKQETDKYHETDDNPYSPPHHNNNNNQSEFPSYTEDMLLIKVEPSSPEKAHIKRDYEEGAGSPLISSTVQVKKPGMHKCFDCDKMFNRACYLTQHNKTFHSGDKPYKCSRCGKRFSCETQYQEHTSKHAGEKPYKCDLCPKQFNHKTDLRRHMCLHTGQKPYACDTCGKGFIRKDHMLKHCETHARKPHVAKVTAVR